MNIAKVKKNINNLKKIREIIEISKFDTLHKLQNANKVTDTFMKMAIKSKNVIEFATNTYWAKSPLLKKVKTEKTLWIFASISSEMLATSYSQQENMILREFNKEEDELLVIGKPALNFAASNNIEPVYKEDDINKALDEVPAIVASLSTGANLPNVKFVSHNSYLADEPIIILPIGKLNIVTEDEPINRKAKFYPSLVASIAYLGSIYAERLTHALLRDAKFYYLKEKLIRHEGSLKSVDKKIEEKTREMNKLGRKVETEELILVSQIAKRGGEDE